jgi:hypothetical protein
MKIIEAGLKLYNDKYQHTNGDPYRQTSNINSGIAFIAHQIAPRYPEVIFKHKIAVN